MRYELLPPRIRDSYSLDVNTLIPLCSKARATTSPMVWMPSPAAPTMKTLRSFMSFS